jgi:LuxR family transcriptional regulator, maltose regulon positive regulatory protein
METRIVSKVSFVELDVWIQALGPLLTDNPPEDTVSLVRGWHTLLYVCMYRQPGHPLIPRAVEFLSCELLHERLPPTLSLQAATSLLAYAHFACDEERAEKLLPLIQRYIPVEEIPPLARVLGATWVLVYLFFDARYEKACQWSEIARELTRVHGLPKMVRNHSWYRVMCLAFLGRHAEALSETRRLNLETSEFHDQSAAAYPATCAALAYFVNGHVSKALQLGEVGLLAFERSGFTTGRYAWVQTMQAIYLMFAGNVDRALALIDDTSAALVGTHCTYPHALLSALRAYAALCQGDRDAAVVHMRAALSTPKNRKRLALLSWARSFLPALLSLAWKENIERDTVQDLVARWSVPAPSRNELGWPWPIIIRLLGNFQVERNGVPLDFGRKPPRKILGLLKAIVLENGRGLSVERAQEWFWADADGDSASASQGVALYRLRKMLGLPDAIQLRKGRLYVNPELVWVDLSAFHRLARCESPQHLTQAFDMYRGPLLADDEYEPWSLHARSTARNVFNLVVDRLAKPLESSDTAAADRLYRRAIEIDPLAEPAYHGLIRCLSSQHRDIEIQLTYQRLKHAQCP